MSKWIDLDLAERRVVLQSVEDKEKLQQAAAIRNRALEGRLRRDAAQLHLWSRALV